VATANVFPIHDTDVNGIADHSSKPGAADNNDNNNGCNHKYTFDPGGVEHQQVQVRARSRRR
jgi:hypothetical protein